MYNSIFKLRPKKLTINSLKETKRFKILVLGDAAVGKSSILDKFCEEKFNSSYAPTIAVDYKNKTIEGS